MVAVEEAMVVAGEVALVAVMMAGAAEIETVEMDTADVMIMGIEVHKACFHSSLLA